MHVPRVAKLDWHRFTEYFLRHQLHFLIGDFVIKMSVCFLGFATFDLGILLADRAADADLDLGFLGEAIAAVFGRLARLSLSQNFL